MNNASTRALTASVLTTLIVTVAILLAGCELETADTDSSGTGGNSSVELPPVSGNVQQINFQQGFGASRDFWQVYFTAPTGSRDSSTYVGGVDTALIDAIDDVSRTLDIAAFEWKNQALTDAVVRAADRGVRVRMVVDDEHVLEEYEDADLFGEPAPFADIINADIPYRDDSRSGLMHNKFMIMDSTTVWTGSMNFTINGTYRNNNNLLMMRSQGAVRTYQAEFDEMYNDGEFGSSRSDVDGSSFSQDGVSVRIVFSPEDEPIPVMINELRQADSQIRFMTFSFTRDDVGQALVALAADGIDVEGIFEVRASRTEFSELPRMFCAGMDVFQDGNPFTFHHKVFIIDDHTVMTGSFNISNNATESNDENLVIIEDRDLAAQYLREYARVRSQAEVPPAAEINCP